VIALERRHHLSFPPPISAEQEVALNQARLTGDAMAREELILANLRLVWHFSRRYAWSGIPQDDLFSAGVQGLIAAIDTYDHARGRLAPHARVHIRKEMLELIAEQRSLLHLPSSVNYHALLISRAEVALSARLGREPADEEIAAEAKLSVQRIRTVRQALGTMVSLDDSGDGEDEGVSLHEALADEDAELADRSAAVSSRTEWLGRALERLAPREQVVLRRHFGLDGNGGRPLAQLAGELSVSRERLRQIEVAALRKLRRLLEIGDAHRGESLGSTDWDSLLREAGLRQTAA